MCETRLPSGGLFNLKKYSRLIALIAGERKMETYPIMLDVKGKDTVVIGGGKVATRKITSLVQAGAMVTVVSPELHKSIEMLYKDKRIFWRRKEFEPKDIETAWIVIAATNSRDINRFVASSTRTDQLVNVVDDLKMGNFQVPAKLSRGSLTISVATEGASPTLAKAIRNELAEIYPEVYEHYLTFLKVAREKIKQSNMSQKTKIKLLQEITKKDFRESEDKQQSFLERIERNVEGNFPGK